MAANGIRHKADAVKPHIPKLSVPNLGQVANAKAFAFKSKVTFHNMPRSKSMSKVLLLSCKINMHLPETALY